MTTTKTPTDPNPRGHVARLQRTLEEGAAALPAEHRADAVAALEADLCEALAARPTDIAPDAPGAELRIAGGKLLAEVAAANAAQSQAAYKTRGAIMANAPGLRVGPALCGVVLDLARTLAGATDEAFAHEPVLRAATFLARAARRLDPDAGGVDAGAVGAFHHALATPSPAATARSVAWASPAALVPVPELSSAVSVFTGVAVAARDGTPVPAAAAAIVLGAALRAIERASAHGLHVTLIDATLRDVARCFVADATPWRPRAPATKHHLRGALGDVRIDLPRFDRTQPHLAGVAVFVDAAAALIDQEFARLDAADAAGAFDLPSPHDDNANRAVIAPWLRLAEPAARFARQMTAYGDVGMWGGVRTGTALHRALKEIERARLARAEYDRACRADPGLRVTDGDKSAR